MAGAMGWGIRGQYGHETGAMIAGVLVSLVLVLLHCPQAASLPAARAVAFGTIAMGIGGSMTYGQTIGLTQNPEVIGNWEAWRWGMLGLGIKGAIWIGFAGLFLGMALGGQRYSGRDVFRLMLGMFVLYAAGWWMLNQPFDPANRILPRVYFSASWRWQPEAGDALRPRPEVWGGLLFALIGAWAWAAWARGDRLARNLALWGMRRWSGVSDWSMPAILACVESRLLHDRHLGHLRSRDELVELDGDHVWSRHGRQSRAWPVAESRISGTNGTRITRLRDADHEDGTRITRIHWRGMATLSRVDARRCSRGIAHRRRIHFHGLGECALRSGSCHRLHPARRGSSRSVVALPRRPANYARADRWQDRSDPRLRRSSDRANWRLVTLCGSAGNADDCRRTLVRAQRQSPIASAGVCANGAPHQHVDLFRVELCLCPLSLAVAGVDSAHAERHHLLRLRNRAHRRQPADRFTAAGSARSRQRRNRDDSGYDSHPGRVLAREEIE